MRHRVFRQETGFTLVEIMIAMVLGLILTGGIIMMFSTNSSTQRSIQENSRLQESARFALSEVVREARMIGFLGCRDDIDLDDSSEFINQVDVSAATNEYLYGIDSEGTMEAYSIPSDGSLTALPGSLQTILSSAEVKPDSDMLIIRTLAPDSVSLSTAMTSNTSIVLTGTGFAEVGDVLFISDCQTADLFTVSAAAESSGNTTLTTNAALSTTYGLDAAVYQYDLTIFYIAKSSVKNSAGDDIWSLYQYTDGVNAELVSGISGLSVSAAIANSGETIPYEYIAASSVTDFNNVIALDIKVTATTIEDIGLDNGRTFIASVKLRNRG